MLSDLEEPRDVEQDRIPASRYTMTGDLGDSK
jgi:hypothetical protein